MTHFLFKSEYKYTGSERKQAIEKVYHVWYTLKQAVYRGNMKKWRSSFNLRFINKQKIGIINEKLIRISNY